MNLHHAPFHIRTATADDRDGIMALYKGVGEAGSGLAREPDEVTPEYVEAFLSAALADGIALVAEDSVAKSVIAEIHAHSLGPRTFRHVLGELTVAVQPRWQGRGLGRALFGELLRRVRDDFPHVERVELKARESNDRAIRMYESLGFRREGRMERRVRLRDGSLDADIPLAWHRH